MALTVSGASFHSIQHLYVIVEQTYFERRVFFS